MNVGKQNTVYLLVILDKTCNALLQPQMTFHMLSCFTTLDGVCVRPPLAEIEGEPFTVNGAGMNMEKKGAF